MYESFYGFNARPFQLNPDPEFFFGSRQHRRAMAFAEYGLEQSEGFIVITGEVGAGKTTLVRNLLGHLDPERVVAANLVSTQLEAEDLLRMIAAAFGIGTKDLAKTDVLLAFEAFLASNAAQGKRSLLIIDEAQNLDARAIEELRMLSNFQLGTHTLLQSFLVGQPEFRATLQSPELDAFRQRVIAACHIGSLDPEDTRGYIEHRLRRVGWRDVPLIMPEAFEAIFAASGGIPRRINLLCDRVLLSGFLTDQRVFSAQTVNEVAEEIRAETVVSASTAGHGRSGRDAVEMQLEHLELEIKDLEAAMSRIERGNQATLALFRRFLEWVQTRERLAGERAAGADVPAERAPEDRAAGERVTGGPQ
jgi:putative secretion ATPase (PEP-CTERM system associated)